MNTDAKQKAWAESQVSSSCHLFCVLHISFYRSFTLEL